MDVVFDTSGIVDVDRGKETTISLLERLVGRGDNLFVSTVTVAEILTGANLHADRQQAQASSRRVLGQFDWIDLDGPVAEEIGRMMAYLHAKGQSIEFQDVAIAASFVVFDADALVTGNEKHFRRLPDVESSVQTPDELLEEVEADGGTTDDGQ